MTVDHLARQLHELCGDNVSPRYLCAVSGGADSLALLHAMAQLPAVNLRAIHINHGLHPDAAQWAQGVASVCARLGIALDIVAVDVASPSNVEAAARDARYAALGAALAHNEILLTAHHIEDQALTLLLQLLRGAGPAGLAAMPRKTPFAQGWHVRPLLELSGATLVAYCAQHSLPVAADPSNDDDRFERNYLRRHLVPVLQARWPAYAATVSRSAANCAEATALLQDLARLDAGVDLSAQPLDLRTLVGLPRPRLGNAIRGFLRAQGLPAPNRTRLDEFTRQLQCAADDKLPTLEYNDIALRVYRQRLYAGPPCASPGQWRAQLTAGGALVLPGALGELRWHTEDTAAASLQVGFRRGGETFDAAPTRSLKTFFQDAGVLPWMRECVPLLWRDDELVAIADLWRSRALDGRIEWLRHAPVILR